MKNIVFLKTDELFVGILDEYKKIVDSGMDCILVHIDKYGKIAKKNKFSTKFTTFNADGYEVKVLPLTKRMYLFWLIKKMKLYQFWRITWDMFDYYLRDLYPEYDYYWFVMQNTYCNGKSYTKFFQKFKNNNTDLIIPCVYKLSEEQKNEKDFIFINNRTVYSANTCIYRLSSKAAAFLKTERRIESMKKRLPDNMFLPTKIQNSEMYSIESIDDQRILFNREINLAENRIYLNPDDLIYFPVV